MFLTFLYVSIGEMKPFVVSTQVRLLLAQLLRLLALALADSGNVLTDVDFLKHLP